MSVRWKRVVRTAYSSRHLANLFLNIPNIFSIFPLCLETNVLYILFSLLIVPFICLNKAADIGNALSSII